MSSARYRIYWFYLFIFFREILKFLMQYFKLLCMSTLLPPLYITICTTVRKTFDILLVAELIIYSIKYFLIWQNKNYSSIYKCIIITSPIGFDITLTKVDATFKQCWYNVVSKLSNFVSMLCNVFLTLFRRQTLTLY